VTGDHIMQVTTVSICGLPHAPFPGKEAANTMWSQDFNVFHNQQWRWCRTCRCCNRQHQL